jgi:hypothetical protein
MMQAMLETTHVLSALYISIYRRRFRQGGLSGQMPCLEHRSAGAYDRVVKRIDKLPNLWPCHGRNATHLTQEALGGRQ